MKNLFWLMKVYVVAGCFSIYGNIVETAHFSEICQYVGEETLVILDIDDTLLIPVQTLGTDVWFCHQLEQYKKLGDYPFALDKALAQWEAIRHLTQVKLVEEGTETFIQQLQNAHITVMGLTTQGLALATRTLNQLKSLDIDLSKTAPFNEDCYFMNQHGVLYRQGILFTSGTIKGKALFKLLDEIDYHPKHILFINDKMTHLQDVEKSALEHGVEFTGLRYAYSDQRVASFKPEIAKVQWNYSTLGHLLSDEEAEVLLGEFSLIEELGADIR